MVTVTIETFFFVDSGRRSSSDFLLNVEQSTPDTHKTDTKWDYNPVTELKIMS